MKYCALSEKGKRQHNEDAVFVPMHSEVALAVVADGMGGHKAGDTASRMALEVMVSEIKRGGGSPEQLIERAVDAANAAVYAASRNNSECRGMGTTAVLAMPFVSYYVAANIGDSRIYHYHDGAVVQVSRDHSYVQELVDSGYITKAQAAVHPRRNVITRAIGTSSKETADIFRREWQPGDMLLLCTDGLHSALEDMDIARILSEESDLEEACKRLVSEALYGGSTDNVSVALILNEV